MITLSLLFLACQGEPESGDPSEDSAAPYDPSIAGAHAVGTYEDALTSSDDVELALQVWYPAQEADDGTASRYRYDGLLDGSALEHSTPACDAPLPVVVFSHGSGGIRFQSIFYTERLATHGYLVVAPDHTGNTFYDNDASTGEMVLRRPQDVMDTFDWLVAESADPSSAIAGCVDPSAGYAITGHSFGGYTSLAVAGATLDVAAAEAFCADLDDSVCDVVDAWKAEHPGETVVELGDERVWASVPMTPAGASLFAAGLAEISVPTLVFGGTLDDTTPYDTESIPIYEGLVSLPRGLAGLEGAGHLSFSDICEIYAAAAECGDGFLPVEDVQRIVNETAVPFLELARGESRAAEFLPPDEAALLWTWENQ